jgi:starch synthase
MPSRFEPCGLNQMYSLRYGTLPLVRATGGLVDTVQNYDESVGGGTGFMFNDLTVDSIANSIGWALSTYYDRPDHIATMRKRAMAQDFSWDRAAADYERLYLDAYQRRRKAPLRRAEGVVVVVVVVVVGLASDPAGSGSTTTTTTTTTTTLS